MLRTFFYLPVVLLRHSPAWFGTLVFAFLGGVGLFAYYPIFRLEHGQWVADHLMIDLPPQISYWHLLWLLVIWITISLAWNEAKRRQAVAQIYFSEPFSWRTGLGKDAKVVIAKKMVDVVSIRIKNHPVNMENGRDVTQAHCHATFRRPGMAAKRVEDTRWTDAPKPRQDETLPGMAPKFTHTMQYMDIPANASWLQIDFAVSNPGEPHFFGFPSKAQPSGWMLPEYQLNSGNYTVDIEIVGRGLATSARTKINLSRSEDGSIFVESVARRQALDFGAVFE